MFQQNFAPELQYAILLVNFDQLHFKVATIFFTKNLNLLSNLGEIDRPDLLEFFQPKREKMS